MKRSSTLKGLVSGLNLNWESESMIYRISTGEEAYRISTGEEAIYNQWAIYAGYPGGYMTAHKQGGWFGQSKGQKALRDKRPFKRKR